jgi:hypothetical protein
MNRRDFIHTASVALGGSALIGTLPSSILAREEAPDVGRLMRHRFGVNYVPSRNWYYFWNDWQPDDIARDFDAIAALGMDHLRLMLIWPWFQPNPKVVSAAHLDRLDRLMDLAAGRKLDVLVTVFNGWLSGYRFTPHFYWKEPFYTSANWRAAQDLFLHELGQRLDRRKNFIGFDLGNEINGHWSCTTAEGDAWMAHVFERMHALFPGRVHVNGLDHQPWFKDTSFSPEALMAQQQIPALHCWSHFTKAGDHGGPLDKPYTHLPAAMAALTRSYGRAPGKPIWVQEFGGSRTVMPEADIPRWTELAVQAAVGNGVSWFTWWGSHDISERFQFHPFEYDLGLLTVENKVKPQGRVFQQLAEALRGRSAVIPDRPLARPPAQRNPAATWAWLLDWMHQGN